MGDWILEYGSLDRANFVNIVTSVVPELTTNKGTPVCVLVERAGQGVPLSLTPLGGVSSVACSLNYDGRYIHVLSGGMHGIRALATSLHI